MTSDDNVTLRMSLKPSELAAPWMYAMRYFFGTLTVNVVPFGRLAMGPFVSQRICRLASPSA